MSKVLPLFKDKDGKKILCRDLAQAQREAIQFARKVRRRHERKLERAKQNKKDRLNEPT